MRIAVVTPSLPERGRMLKECMDSVFRQSLPPVAHLIEVDYERAGCARVLNRLASAALAAKITHLALLGDDDLFYENHLEILAAEAQRTNAPVVYSWGRVTGREGWNPNSTFDAGRLRHENYIPSTSLISLAHVKAIGGWRPNAAMGWEDWDFWLRSLDAGAAFVCVPKYTWIYRFHGENISCA